ncbi:unnamed protein product [Clonostachys chloroleuca]|uniref:Uncharacterized protein n=1 Tax=Clonostachys chloroleuca TaxID=1926264 RepID=A0AA35LV57_9HYPO|nr:unnamed protein product [Clonostachys chloroleuca]
MFKQISNNLPVPLLDGYPKRLSKTTCRVDVGGMFDKPLDDPMRATLRGDIKRCLSIHITCISISTSLKEEVHYLVMATVQGYIERRSVVAFGVDIRTVFEKSFNKPTQPNK